ncbi:hypothetical protein STEG23_028698 [Scotinomys teguina]
MGRLQCKNTANNIKTSMVPPECSGVMSIRPEHPEAEEINCRSEFKKIIEDIKEDLKTTLKEYEEKFSFPNKKLEDITQSLKESQEKAIKQVNETVQELKTEIEAIKNTQTEGKLEMENLILWQVSASSTCLGMSESLLCSFTVYLLLGKEEISESFNGMIGEYSYCHHRAFLQELMEENAEIHSKTPDQTPGIESKREKRDSMGKGIKITMGKPTETTKPN